MVTKVKLRFKNISENRQSLYLDFYPPILHPETDKPTRREFLNLFLFNENETEEQMYLDKNGKEKKRLIPLVGKKGEPKKVRLNPINKKHNEETLQIAEQIRQKRDNQLNKPEIYTGYEKAQLKIREMENTSFLEYFCELKDKRKASNHDNWVSAYHYLEKFTGGKLKFVDLDEKFCNDFKDYLCNTYSNRSEKVKLSQNSAFSYFNKFKATLKQAHKDGFLRYNLNARIDRIKEAETHRNFLTLEELNNLIQKDCLNPLLKNAALFSALTGFRFGDIAKLTWGEVEFIKGNGYFIQFTQQKTNGVEMMPISEQAYNLMGERKEPNQKVFNGLTYSAYSNKHLAQWIGSAGITKNITFHCFRHTYATLQLSNGTDFYTVSKMLGHRDPRTTQVYTKIINQAKRDATDKIVLKF
jgi:integrase